MHKRSLLTLRGASLVIAHPLETASLLLTEAGQNRYPAHGREVTKRGLRKRNQIGKRLERSSERSCANVGDEEEGVNALFHLFQTI